MTFWACIWICLIKIEALCTKNEDFDHTYVNTGSKTQKFGKVKPRFDIPLIISGKISKVLVSKTPS